MSILRSFAICFSMYSRIPMPRVKWEESSMRYVFCFFPLIGAVIGGLELGWFALCSELQLSVLLYAAVAVVLPILVTGGIHMDGFMDTCDALFSYGDREKKLEIMKDPRTGAFAVMYCGVYLLLSFGLFAQLFLNGSFLLAGMAALGYLYSRCICGLSVVSLPCAKTSGLAHMFQSSADRKFAGISLIVWLVLLLAGSAFLSLRTVLFMIMLTALAVLLFVWICKKQFGGITGDLAGFAVQLCELAALIAAVIVI